MNNPRNAANKIVICKVEQGRSSVNCHPLGVGIQFVESSTQPRNSNREYLRTLLESHGFEASHGAKIQDIPFYYLCVGRQGAQVRSQDVLVVLREDPEIDVSGLHGSACTD